VLDLCFQTVTGSFSRMTNSLSRFKKVPATPLPALVPSPSPVFHLQKLPSPCAQVRGLKLCRRGILKNRRRQENDGGRFFYQSAVAELKTVLLRKTRLRDWRIPSEAGSKKAALPKIAVPRVRPYGRSHASISPPTTMNSGWAVISRRRRSSRYRRGSRSRSLAFR